MDYLLPRPIVIRFDGLEASGKLLEMYSFGTSLVGVSRVLKSSAHFAFRHEYAAHRDKPHIRILARPPQDGSFVLEAVAIAQTGYPLFQPLLADVTWKLITTVTGVIFLGQSGRHKIVNRLLDTTDNLVKEQGIRDESARKDLVGIVHKLIDNSQNAVRDAIHPIGKTCDSLLIGDQSAGAPVIDLPTVDAIKAEGELDVDDERKYRGRFDSVTLHTKHCSVELDDKGGKFTPGKITDPEILKDENFYTKALHEGAHIEMTAKALKTKEGTIKTLYISNARVINGKK